MPLPGLNRSNVPASALALPERAVQFGTGAFLRGFVDAFLDDANRAGLFNGRVVAIGSTNSGREAALNSQAGLYTLSVEGVDGGKEQREQRLIAAVSRALSAQDEWNSVLACARNPELAFVFSNSTEVGILLDADDSPSLVPPRSFPGKLTRFLFERATAFAFDEERGLVVLPCELIENNGTRLREIVMELAHRWEYGDVFSRWLERAVPFCNTLVDRIVPGAPGSIRRQEIEQVLGYHDELLTMCEPYRLFAIEGDAALRARLSFAGANQAIVVSEDIAPYRERKLRLLNGAHTLMAPVGVLCGCVTVNEALRHPLVGPFVREALFGEIVPVLAVDGAAAFAQQTMERFANPYLAHALMDIMRNAAMKVRVRIVPTIQAYARQNGRVPRSLAFAFASYLEFMRGSAQDRRGASGGAVLPDALGEKIRELWAGLGKETGESLGEFTGTVCSDRTLWDSDLADINGFVDAVAAHLVNIRRAGTAAALKTHLSGRNGVA